jgi:hypothetical protein
MVCPVARVCVRFRLSGEQPVHGREWLELLVNYGSLRLGDVNGDARADICGRGGAGIWCALTGANGIATVATLWTPKFGNADFWNQPQYGTTIMLADINGDRRADVCGRGDNGVWCGLSTGNSFEESTLGSSHFSDASNWDELIYYGSIRLADVNGNGRADVCGRGGAGIWCGLSRVVFQ